MQKESNRQWPTPLGMPPTSDRPCFEVKLLLQAIEAIETREPYALMAKLMYGIGMRIMECCRLRVKEVDFERGHLIVRQGKGDKDRGALPYPQTLRDEMAEQIQSCRRQHQRVSIKGIAGAFGCKYNHDLHACDATRRCQSFGSTVSIDLSGFLYWIIVYHSVAPSGLV